MSAHATIELRYDENGIQCIQEFVVEMLEKA